MAKNEGLSKAKQGKNDEFYTQLSDIENELRHYKEHFKGKTVFCNCDDPYESNFFKYFALNFNVLGLKKLIAVSYAGSPLATTEVSLFEEEGAEYKLNSKKAYKVTMVSLSDVTGDGRIDLDDVREIVKPRIRYLKGDGGFESEESIELLKEADIVVSNPPFSKFKEYVAQLIQYNKKFIIVGNQNAITYKGIFPLIMNNEMWLGYGFKGNVGFFINTQYKDYAVSSQHKEGMIRVSGVMWFTNLDISKRHDKLDLYKKYTPEEYPTYETYNAIDVSKTADIPMDYDGVMGVPKTFMSVYCPEQFEILGYEREDENIKVGITTMPETFLEDYRNQGGKGHYTKGMKMLCYYDSEGKAKIPFSRILIRKKVADNGN